MSSLGLIHSGFAVLALVVGAVVLWLPKGGRRHRTIGTIYVVAMVALNVTALMIYRLLGHVGPFHFAAAVSLITVLAGWTVARRRVPRHGWVFAHAYWMAWSYVGLVAAAAAEILTRVVRTQFWWIVGGATAITVIVGAYLIETRLRPLLGSERWRAY